MNVLIVGAGRSGTYLAEKLRGGHDVTMVEMDADRAALVDKQLTGITVVRGDGCEPNVLERAGAARADLIAALTGDDEDNLVVSFLAKRTHSVPLVFARTNHPANEWLFTKDWGVDVGVSAAGIIYNLIEKEIELGDIVTLLRLQAGNMAIEELKLPHDADSVGKTLSDITMPACAQVMAIMSGGEIVVPRGDTVLQAGDELLLLSQCGQEKGVRRAFGVHSER